jgi:hypothetical protein
MKALNIIVLSFIIGSLNSISSQEKFIVIQKSKIDSIENLKIELDRKKFKSEYFTIQLYYGDLSKAEEIISKFQEKYPLIDVKISFETPNYKVQAGNYKFKIIGLKTLDTLKRDFPSAFLLIKKEL